MINAFQASHWPWHAAIYHKNKQSVREYKCGGTVISSKSILTAAHCVSIYGVVMDADNIFVDLGRLNLGVNEISSQLFEVIFCYNSNHTSNSVSYRMLQPKDIVLHPNYSSIDYSNDIAIIQLSNDATFNNFVQPVCLWRGDTIQLSEVIGRNGTVIGFGKTENFGYSRLSRNQT